MLKRGTDRALSARPTVSIDALEPRRLFTVELEITNTLVITATDGNDFITVDLDVDAFGGRTLRIQESGVVTGTFTQGAVVDILVLCGDGDDFVRIGSGGFAGSVTTPAQIEGGDGNDEINGGAGSDTIFGGNGDDFITGYAGNDFVDAGEGNDVVVVHIGGDTVFGGPGDDQLNGQETGKSSSFDGGDGNDQITGTSRRDFIYGRAGNDSISGGKGTDRIFGGDGSDQITLNSKSARVHGEGGADVYFGANGKGRKSIKDFVDGEDSIQPLPPTAFAPATQAATSLVRDDLSNLLG